MSKKLFEKICGHDSFVHTSQDEEYSIVSVDNHKEVLKIDSQTYRHLIEYRLYIADEDASKTSIDKIVQLARLHAKYKGKEQQIHHRIAEYNGHIYYDLCNSNWEAIRITPQGWKTVHPKKVLFERYSMQEPQVVPRNGGNLKLIRKYIRNVPRGFELLFIVHIVLCFIPNITHAPIILQSEKGSGKTTITTMLKKIIDPCGAYSMTLPKKESDMYLVLRENYLANFDNVSYISQEISNALCKAVTGTVEARRKLYTDGDLYSFAVKNSIIINGISFITLRDDLVDRSIALELVKPDENIKMADSKFWSDFDADLPFILGWIFDTISKALSLYSTSIPKTRFRLEDYAQWGHAIAEAQGGYGQKYLNALDKNVILKNKQLIAMDALASAVIVYLRRLPSNHWEGRPLELMHELENVAKSEKLISKQAYWPKTPQSLTVRLKKVQDMLRSEKIEMTFLGHVNNKGSKIVIEKKSL